MLSDAFVAQYAEPLKLPGGILIADMTRIDTCQRRTGMTPGEQLGDAAGCSFGDQFHIPIREIAHPASQTEALRLVPGRGPEENALHTTRHLNKHPSPPARRHRLISQQ